MRNTGSNVHSVPHEEEGRRVLRPGRAQEESRRHLLREGPQQPRVLRVRRPRTSHATCLLSGATLLEKGTVLCNAKTHTQFPANRTSDCQWWWQLSKNFLTAVKIRLPCITNSDTVDPINFNRQLAELYTILTETIVPSLIRMTASMSAKIFES